jgi:hypothetical protein
MKRQEISCVSTMPAKAWYFVFVTYVHSCEKFLTPCVPKMPGKVWCI